MNYILEKKMKDMARIRCSCLRGMRKFTKFSEDRMSVRLDCSSIRNQRVLKGPYRQNFHTTLKCKERMSSSRIVVV
jgi:hypothetical protein